MKMINIPAFLAFNVLILLLSYILWQYQQKPEIDNKWAKNFYKNAINSLKKDKILFLLFVFFIFSSLISLFLAIYAPPAIWDAMSYQVARVAFWIQNETLAHFETGSVRQVIFPPNSEILLLWIMLFIKRDFMLGMVQYMAYFASLFTIYSFLSYLKVSTSRIIWTILLTASVPGFIIHSSSTQNHLILGFLLLVSLYLFIYGVFENEKKSIVFSAIALGISIGVKSSVFLFLPGFFIAYFLIAVKKQGWNFYKIGFQYFLYTVFVFLLLSSYFYIMNYLEFGHPLGVKSYIYEHTYSSKSVEAFAANIIRYISIFIDFTGADPSWNTTLSFPVNFIRTFIFNLTGISPEAGLTNQGSILDNLILVNTSASDLRAGLGPLGFLLLLPLLFLSITKYIFSSSKRTFLIGLCGAVFVVFIITLSIIMGYELWNNRYFITAAVISSPVFALSYMPKNKPGLLKLMIFGICLFSFIKIPLFNEVRPIFPVNGYSLLFNTRDEILYYPEPGAYFDNIFLDPVTYLTKAAPRNSKIGVMLPDSFWYYQFFSKNQGWQIYSLNLELITEEKLKNMDFLVVYGEKHKVYSLIEHKNYKKEIKIDFNKIKKHFKRELTIKTNLKNFINDKTPYGNVFKFYIFKNKSLEK